MATKWYTVKRRGQGTEGAYVVLNEKNYDDVAAVFPVPAGASDDDDDEAYAQADALKRKLNSQCRPY